MKTCWPSCCGQVYIICLAKLYCCRWDCMCWLLIFIRDHSIVVFMFLAIVCFLCACPSQQFTSHESLRARMLWANMNYLPRNKQLQMKLLVLAFDFNLRQQRQVVYVACDCMFPVGLSKSAICTCVVVQKNLHGCSHTIVIAFSILLLALKVVLETCRR